MQLNVKCVLVLIYGKNRMEVEVNKLCPQNFAKESVTNSSFFHNMMLWHTDSWILSYLGEKCLRCIYYITDENITTMVVNT